MDWKKLAPLLLLSKPLMIIVAIIAAVLLIVPIIIIWAYGLMTGLIFFAITMVGIFALAQMKFVDTEKSSWILLLPFIAFFVGVVVEKGRVFQIMPLSTINFSLFSTQPQVALNIAVSSVILLVIAVCLVIGFAVERT